MMLSIFTWVLLVVIAVSDAKAHRIPNKFLLLLLMSLCLSTFVQIPEQVVWSVLLNKFMAFGIAFIFALILYLLRVMAPGDVKLVAVLGCLLGTNELTSYLYYVSLITAFVGTMYWLLNRSYVPLKTIYGAGLMSFADMQIRQQHLKSKIAKRKEPTYMPFAPILVMGLALHQYYS